MITYVNTVFVSNNQNVKVVFENQLGTSEKGDFVLRKHDESMDPSKRKFMIGINTGKFAYDNEGKKTPVVRWSNWIKYDDIKSIVTHNYAPSTEDKVVLDFSKVDSNIVDLFALGGKRIIVRLTFKDLPTRYRKWTESYEYVTEAADVTDESKATAYKEKIAKDIADMINKQWKRARVEAAAEGAKVTFTAMPYDDDNSADSISWANKVRFNANVYFTDPAADGWESLNKKTVTGLSISKSVGKWDQGEGKIVRDRESQAMGYLGILNRGECTWPIIKPAMEANIEGKYDVITIEFENIYRAADDIFRKTKQAVEIYVPQGKGSALATNLTSHVKDEAYTTSIAG